MGESSLSNLSRTFHDELTGRIMVVGIVLLFFVIAFVIFLHLYAKWYWYRREEEAAAAAATTTVVHRRRRLDFAPGYIESAASATGIRRGLDSSVLKSIPVVKFNSKELEKGLECAVCLSELVDGEKARLLPKCNHGFHVDCIDMWFQSHSTCPLCRNPIFTPISNSPELNLASILQPPRAENSAVFPTNVLFWGSQAQVSTLSSAMDEDLQASATVSSSSSSSPPPPCQPNCSSSSSNSSRSDGMLVIDIPRQIVEDEEQKSPVTTRFRSLKRLLSRDRRVNPCGPSGDAE